MRVAITAFIVHGIPVTSHIVNVQFSDWSVLNYCLSCTDCGHVWIAENIEETKIKNLHFYLFNLFILTYIGILDL